MMELLEEFPCPWTTEWKVDSKRSVLNDNGEKITEIVYTVSLLDSNGKCIIFLDVIGGDGCGVNFEDHHLDELAEIINKSEG